MRADRMPIRVVIVTLDMHLSRTVRQAQAAIAREIPGLTLSFHAASAWENDPAALDRCRSDIASANIVIATMLFMDDQIRAILPALQARREACDAMVVAMSAPEVVKLTKLGSFRMDAPQTGALALLKKLRGSAKSGHSGEGQMAMLRRLPKILRLIPGKAQDVRAYFLTMQYWLAGSEANIANLVRCLINRYADGDRRALRGTLDVPLPAEYPDIGVYHPRIAGRLSEQASALPAAADGALGTVGVLVLRSYIWPVTPPTMMV